MAVAPGGGDPDPVAPSPSPSAPAPPSDAPPSDAPPSEAAAPPPAPSGGGFVLVLLGLAALLVVAATTGVVVWALTSDDGSEAEAGPRTGPVPRPSAFPRTTTGEATGTTGTTGATGADPSTPGRAGSTATTGGGPPGSTTGRAGTRAAREVSGTDDAFTLAVPDGWVAAEMGEDSEGAAARAFPDDPDAADTMQRALDAFADENRASGLPDTGLIAIDADALDADDPVAELLLVTGDGTSGDDLGAVVDAMREQAAAAGSEVVDDGRLETPAGTWAWQEVDVVDAEGGPDVVMVEYAAIEDGVLWHVTFYSDEMDEQRDVVDAIVESLTPA